LERGPGAATDEARGSAAVVVGGAIRCRFTSAVSRSIDSTLEIKEVILKSVLRIRIRDPVLFFDPWIRDGKKSGSRVRDEDPGSYFRELRDNFLGSKYFNSFEGSGSRIFLTLDGKHPGPATLLKIVRALQQCRLHNSRLKIRFTNESTES
jgi:hypothetical protein